MPSNAESFANSYVNSVEVSWNREREEAKSLLVIEEGNRAAYISSLEQSIRAADDDIRNWTNLQGTADRAERRLILERQRLSLSRAKSRRRGLRSGSVAGQAFDKLEAKFAKAATGKGEKGLNLAGAMAGSGGRSKEQQALALISILQNETDLAGLIATSRTGSQGTAGIESSVAGGSGIMRTLLERNARGAGLGVDREVLQMAAAGMVGLWGVGPEAPVDHHQLLDPAMASQMRGAVAQRANTAVASASSGGEDKALADELERSGFLLEDFLPAMEASGLIRGLVGAFQFMGEGRQQQQELEAETTALAAEQAEFDAMTPNERLLFRTTGQAMGSFQKHGSNIPPGVSEDLWTLATQIANQSKAGGFASRDDIVVQARALVGQLDSTKNMSPEERENALEQTLEFYSMQKMGDFPPPVSPVERVVDEVTQAVEDADPDAGRGNRSDAAKAAAKAKAAAEAKAKAEADAKAKAKKEERKTAGRLGLSTRDLRFISNLGMKRGVEALYAVRASPSLTRDYSGPASRLKSENSQRAEALQNSGFPPDLIRAAANRASTLSFSEYPPGVAENSLAKKLYEQTARQHAYGTMLDMIAQQQGSESLSLPRYLEVNPDAGFHVMGSYRGSEAGAAVLSAAERGRGIEGVAGLMMEPEEYDAAYTTSEDWDELLNQLAERQELQVGEDRSLEETLSAVEGI